MAREIITIECTEARKEGKSLRATTTTRNKSLRRKSWKLRNTIQLFGGRRSIAKSNKDLCLEKLVRTNLTNAVAVPLWRNAHATPEAKIDFTVDALDFKNINLLKQFGDR